MNKKIKIKSGSISLFVLIFGIVTSVVIGGLVIVAATQYTSGTRTEVYEKSLTIAQAGAEYYRWHLAHNPNDFQDGTNQNGPYLHTINDPYGQTEANFSLDITKPASGSSIVTITSTGWLSSYPNIKRTVTAKYGIPSLSKFAFLHNANVWFGSGLTVQGPILSNGGIRMDGENLSKVQSAKATYSCGSETGCSPVATKNGVWGSGGPTNLWENPVPVVDFNSLAVDFNNMRTKSQTNGLYLPPSGSFGYHILFLSSGNFTVYKVNNALNRKGWDAEIGCQNLYQNISNEVAIGTYSIANKPLIFAEDNIWVNGVVNGRATVVAAKFPLGVNFMNIWIPNNLTYVAKDGSSSLGLFAQNNIYFGLEVPSNFEIDGALLASSGRIIRHNYNYSGCSSYSNAVRNNLTIYGSIISNQKSYWNYGTPPSSGFQTRTITYDSTLYYDPPPYFPTNGDYEFITWEEK